MLRIKSSGGVVEAIKEGEEAKTVHRISRKISDDLKESGRLKNRFLWGEKVGDRQKNPIM